MLKRTFLKHTIVAAAIFATVSLFTPRAFALPATAASDLAPYKALANEALKMVKAGDMAGAKKKGQQIESEWDAKSLGGPYPDLDEQMDNMNDALSSGNAKKATAEITKYLQMLDAASK